jgi:hypothetical protein
MAAVADDGTAAGFAYPEGWGETDGSFEVVLLGPDGTVRLREHTPRVYSEASPNRTVPLGLGVWIDPEHDRFLLRVNEQAEYQHVERWWIYRLSSAQPVLRLQPAPLHPDPQTSYHVITALPVPRTPLMLVQWWCHSRKLNWGAAFTLVGLDGRPVWQLDLPGDYEDRHDEEAAGRLRREIEKQSAILGFDKPRQFTLRLARAGQAVTFAVDATETGDWSVRELASTPYVTQIPELPPLEELPRIVLEPLGQITLHNPPGIQDPEIRDIGLFACADDGRLGFLRGSGEFILVDGSGRTRSIPLPEPSDDPNAKWQGCIGLGNRRFLVVRSAHTKGSKALAWWIDPDAGTVTPLPTPLPATMQVAPFSDGGFVVLTWRRYDSSIPLLSTYDRAGKLLSTIQDLHQFGATAWSRDLCLTPAGKIAVLTSDRTVVVLEPSGQLFNRVTLTLDEQPIYLCQIRAWAGGFVLFDASKILIFDTEGALLRTIEASPAETVRPRFLGLNTTRDGHLWTTDHQELRCLDMAGNTTRVFGRPPDPDRLEVPQKAILGWDDRFYVLDARTHAIHVFNPNGIPLRVLQPLPTDQLDHLRSSRPFPPMTLDAGRNVYLGPLSEIRRGISFPTSRYLAFDSEGLRLGPVDLGGSAGRDCQFQPETQTRWVWGSGWGWDELSLVDAEGQVLQKQQRRADGTWFGRLPMLAVGRDGSLAILEPPRSWTLENAPPNRLTFVNSAGAVIRTLDIPHYAGRIDGLALGSRHAVLIGERAGLFVNLEYGSPEHFELPERSGPRKPFLNAAGTELLLCGHDRTVHRFQLPISHR